MTVEDPTHLNIAEFFLDARVREGRGDRTALITDAGRLSYREVQALANRFANVLSAAGVAPEQRVIIALPDGPRYVAALFGILKIGAVVVMVNPELKPDAIEYFFQYSRATVALVAAERADAFQAAAGRAAHAPELLAVGGRGLGGAILGGARDLEELPHPPRRSRHLAVLRRHHRPAQGGGPAAPLLHEHGAVLWRPGAPLHRRRRDPLGAEALFRLCHRLQPAVSVHGRRHQRPVRRPLHGGGRLQPRSPATGRAS